MSHTLSKIGVFCMGLALVSLIGCEAGSSAKRKSAKVPGPSGELVEVSGRLDQVDNLVAKVSDLKQLATEAKTWFDRYKESSHSGESAASDKALRDLKKASGDIVALVQSAKRSSELVEVSGATSVLDSYESFAKDMLKQVENE